MSKPKLITHGGRTLNIAQWSAELGIDHKTFSYRLQRCPDKAFHKGRMIRGNNRKATLYEHDGKALTARQWAAELNIATHTFRSRLSNRPNKAFTPGNLPRVKKPERLYTHDGRSLTAAQWSAELGIANSTFKTRIRKMPKTAFTPGKVPASCPAKRHEYGGKLLTVREITALTGYSESIIRKHISLNKPLGPKPKPEPLKTMDQIHRPYFTFSRGGGLKQRGDSSAPPAHAPRGHQSTFSKHLRAAGPRHVCDFVAQKTHESDQ
jgi:hypothetical protein